MTLRFAWLIPVSLASAGCGTDSCFVPGTRVRTPDGERSIEDLVVDDPIIAYDPVERREVVGRVAAVHRALVREVRTITAGTLGIRGVTSSHPFFELRRNEFVACAELRVGDRLLGADGREVAITSIVAHELAEPLITVVNLTVGDAPPTFFAEGVLVHNKSYPVECTPEQQHQIVIESSLTTACVGDRFPIRAIQGGFDWCNGRHAVPAVFATSDPALLVVEGEAFDPAVAIARGAGTVTVTALFEGKTATQRIAISECGAANGDAAEGG
jgi:hypothetical protein